MSELNFGAVESATGERAESTFKSVAPGLHTLEITDLQPTVAGTGIPGVVITFTSREADASFNERFWLSAKAASRLQYLVEKYTGVKMTDSFSGEGQSLAESVVATLAGRLLGKAKTVIVDGELRTKEKDGNVYTNTYPVLRYAGFVDPEGANAEPRITDRTMATTTTTSSNSMLNDITESPF